MGGGGWRRLGSARVLLTPLVRAAKRMDTEHCRSFAFAGPAQVEEAQRKADEAAIAQAAAAAAPAAPKPVGVKRMQVDAAGGRCGAARGLLACRLQLFWGAAAGCVWLVTRRCCCRRRLQGLILVDD